MSANRVTCTDCHAELGERYAETPRLACPHCGSMARTFEDSATATFHFTAWLDWEHTYFGWKVNGWLLAITAMLTVAATVAGEAVAGTLGIIAGLLFSVASFVFGIFAIDRHAPKTQRGTTRPPGA